MTGQLWFVVGPSGAGKDTVLAGLAAGLSRAPIPRLASEPVSKALR